MTAGARRRYDSSGRQEAAERRRTAILDAAADQFAVYGWVRTTLASVAAQAGVSVELIGQRIGSKGDLLLAALRHRAFRHDGDLRAAIVALDLPARRSAERIDLMVGFATDSLSRIAPFIPALHQAAESDTAAAALLADIRAQRRVTAGIVAAALVDQDPAPVEVVEQVYVATSAEVFLVFLRELGVGAEGYAAWLRAQLAAAVEGASPGPVDGSQAR